MGTNKVVPDQKHNMPYSILKAQFGINPHHKVVITALKKWSSAHPG
jgi:hypothetical protein